ncbi:hypothetical protein [Candidatus Igneacidithiobacillus taiwanensis]|uniref:hypothetical protein n=1 Tax=Candidatus Igneacidithiobacillus taiwanensis TaxID=1945924 RepID=UPI00289E05B7|nr:hypothetical protein [Candidatus Igneacidithiobacillus taiwanensis]
MSKVTLTEGAKLVGISRVTLYKHIRDGSLSIDRDEKGKPKVDTSELLRVFGTLSSGLESNPEDCKVYNDSERTGIHELTIEIYKKMATLQAELDASHALFKAKQEELDRALAEIEWLRKKVDSMEQRLLAGPETKRRWWWPW